MDKVFVFGSNLAGRHGKGAAKDALNYHGAIYGIGEGYQGNSYAIPTKGRHLEVLSLPEIERNVNRFIHFVNQHPELEFYVTAVGCGLAGYSPEQIAPFFGELITKENVELPESFVTILASQI